jgi:hypothetical protein
LANLIEQRVEMARRGQNPFVICRMASGWLVIGDVQPLPGYCVLLADPVIDKRHRPAWVGYDWPTSRRYDPVVDRAFVEAMRARLKNSGAPGG